jgi:glycerophosphoryl diester phosphodiesterase
MGHRGAAASAPENTLAGFRQAFGEGAPWVEFDVKLTADDVPVVLHDDLLDRVSAARGPVADRSLADLKALEVGAWFGDRFLGEPIPTLVEVLDLLASLGLGANIEIKPCPGRSAETARWVLAVARAHWATALPVPVVSSFDLEALAVARTVALDWPLALLADGSDGWTTDGLLSKARDLDCQAVHLDDVLATEERITACKRAGLSVGVWTVNDPDRAHALWDWGVDAIITDRPGVLLSSTRHRPDPRE